MNSNLKTRLNSLIEEMMEAPDEERLEAFGELKNEFCEGCGTRQSFNARHHGGQKCQCQNDE